MTDQENAANQAEQTEIAETPKTEEELAFSDELTEEGQIPSDDNFDLSEFDGDFKEAKAFSFAEIPNGVYKARILKVFLAMSSTGNKMLKWKLEIADGQYEGVQLKKHNMIMNRENLDFLKGDLEKAGMDVESLKLSEMTSPNWLRTLLDNIVEITVKNQKENPPNIFFNKLLGRGSSTEGDEIPE